jgi:hypothetical protein
MNPAAQFVVDARHVVHETIDDETILIHLGTGVYYSLEREGSTIWTLAAAGLPVGEIVALLQAAHPADAGTVQQAVPALVQELADEQLLVPGLPDDLPDLPAPPPGAGFVAPALARFTDMQEFMLVDPLHEVDDAAGWPNVKSG